MLKRCYSKATSAHNVSYKGCTVWEEWLTFSNFKSWMEKQDWEGKDLDKDLLGYAGYYSPFSCCFIPPHINKFILSKGRGKLTGTTKRGCKWLVIKSGVYLGGYTTAEEAHEVWRLHKYKEACILAEDIEDYTARTALKNKYLPIYWYTNNEEK